MNSYKITEAIVFAVADPQPTVAPAVPAIPTKLLKYNGFKERWQSIAKTTSPMPMRMELLASAPFEASDFDDAKRVAHEEVIRPVLAKYGLVESEKGYLEYYVPISPELHEIVEGLMVPDGGRGPKQLSFEDDTHTHAYRCYLHMIVEEF